MQVAKALYNFRKRMPIFCYSMASSMLSSIQLEIDAAIYSVIIKKSLFPCIRLTRRLAPKVKTQNTLVNKWTFWNCNMGLNKLHLGIISLHRGSWFARILKLTGFQTSMIGQTSMTGRAFK